MGGTDVFRLDHIHEREDYLQICWLECECDLSGSMAENRAKDFGAVLAANVYLIVEDCFGMSCGQE